MRRQRLQVLAGAVALTLAVAACGSDDDSSSESDTTEAGSETTDAGSETTDAGADTTDAGADMAECETVDSVSLQLQWFTQAQFAGYYAAIDKGYYENM